MTAEFWVVFNSSRNAMVLMDDGRRYVALNAAARRLLGLKDGPIDGMRLDDHIPVELLNDLAARWAAFLRRGHHYGHYPLDLPSGERIEIEYSATASVLPGRHLAIWLERAGRATSVEALTPREREVVREIADGATTQEIAQRLFISPATVDTHVRKAMGRLGAKNRAHLIALALQQDAL